ncbi:hypothetical protein IHE33_11440 [Mycetohabitans endofungorum]|uniref:hypothetical protein n=1 Tax=Mycetohabitans endofungorum TaxID=417203 RepID=UPI0030CC34CD
MRALLAAAGTPIGLYDVRIAGQVRARNLVLITHRKQEFVRVPGLALKDWKSWSTAQSSASIERQLQLPPNALTQLD